MNPNLFEFCGIRVLRATRVSEVWGLCVEGLGSRVFCHGSWAGLHGSRIPVALG